MTRMLTKRATVLYPEESYRIVGACMEVHSELGPGFLEPVYQEALAIVLAEQDIPFARERPLPIRFRGRVLSKTYVADFVCYDSIILELKALSQLTSEHEAQVLNYLKATGHRLGILANFGAPRFLSKRLVL